LSPKDTVEDHLNARHFVFEQIKVEKEKGNKVVVVTHHAPSFQSISDEFKGDGLNGAYATELFEHIMELEDAQPELWCHGHLHSSNNYMIGKTRVLCNPRGYDTGNPMDLNPEFNVNLVIEV
jgi:Icc-related predicted phosphoesterase